MRQSPADPDHRAAREVHAPVQLRQEGHRERGGDTPLRRMHGGTESGWDRGASCGDACLLDGPAGADGRTGRRPHGHRPPVLRRQDHGQEPGPGLGGGHAGGARGQRAEGHGPPLPRLRGHQHRSDEDPRCLHGGQRLRSERHRLGARGEGPRQRRQGRRGRPALRGHRSEDAGSRRLVRHMRDLRAARGRRRAVADAQRRRLPRRGRRGRHLARRGRPQGGVRRAGGAGRPRPRPVGHRRGRRPRTAGHAEVRTPGQHGRPRGSGPRPQREGAARRPVLRVGHLHQHRPERPLRRPGRPSPPAHRGRSADTGEDPLRPRHEDPRLSVRLGRPDGPAGRQRDGVQHPPGDGRRRQAVRGGFRGGGPAGTGGLAGPLR